MGVLLRCVSGCPERVHPRPRAMVPSRSMTPARGRANEAMEQRRLGRTDIVASVLGFGGSEIGYQSVSARTVARLLRSALDAGLNVIDTAECYDDSEILIGKAIGSRRRGGYLFTQCGDAGGLGGGGRRRAPPPPGVQ